MKLWNGTSGFSYTAWKGKWYPKDLSGEKMLAYYAERFPAVEINGSFYRMPSASSLKKWALETPKAFQFAFKAPGAITHRRWTPATPNLVSDFIAVTKTLENRLGPLLFQFPPYLKKDMGLLEGLFEAIGNSVRVAVEFRHASWFEEDVFARLLSAKACLVFNDTDVEEMPFVATARWGYLRLRRTEYSTPALKKILAQCRAQKRTDVYAFFKHEDEATGPKLAKRFSSLL